MTFAPVHRTFALPVLGRTGLLFVIGIGVGFAVNRVHPKGVRLERYVPPTMCSASLAEAARISLLPPTQAAQLCGKPDTLVADVRDADAFAKGHIASAVHIPCSGSVADVAKVRLALAGKRHLVVCGENEEQGNQVASDLMRQIDRPDVTIAVISGGWNAWYNAGLACASGPCDDCSGEVSHAGP
jgi:rhodanese-related sulfurtransferase